jgi:hypothetical protein
MAVAAPMEKALMKAVFTGAGTQASVIQTLGIQTLGIQILGTQISIRVAAACRVGLLARNRNRFLPRTKIRGTLHLDG